MMFRRLMTLAVGLMALLATGTVAAADTTGHGHRPPRAVLELTVAGDAGVLTTVRLTCAPVGGNHPKRRPACTELTAVSGDLDKLPGRQIMCTMEYRPVTATAHGHWHGRAVTWQRVHSNGCMLRAQTGSVFDFGPRI